MKLKRLKNQDKKLKSSIYFLKGWDLLVLTESRGHDYDYKQNRPLCVGYTKERLGWTHGEKVSLTIQVLTFS